MGRIKDDSPISAKKKTQLQTKKTVWSTKKVDEWMRDYAEGITHRDNPWLDGMIGIRNPNIVFEYTEEEIQELTKCANDIFYFANNYGYCLQGSKGYQPLTLRDYQEEMLDSYTKNRFNITLSCRQIGKCLIFNELDTKKDGNVSHKYIEDIYLERKKDFLSKLKSILFKIYRKL